jgi:hypothetical protein
LERDLGSHCERIGEICIQTKNVQLRTDERTGAAGASRPTP